MLLTFTRTHPRTRVRREAVRHSPRTQLDLVTKFVPRTSFISMPTPCAPPPWGEPQTGRVWGGLFVFRLHV